MEDHKLVFSKSSNDNACFNIDWAGAVALYYAGYNSFDYRFRAELKDIPFLGLIGPPHKFTNKEEKLASNLVEREKNLRALASYFLKYNQDDFVFELRDSSDLLVLKSNKQIKSGTAGEVEPCLLPPPRFTSSGFVKLAHFAKVCPF